jgi:putative DNA primase/helicase
MKKSNTHVLPCADAVGTPDPAPPDDGNGNIAKAAEQTRALPNRTDLGNAELFARLNRDNVRFDHRAQRWLLWRKHWWAEDSDGRVLRLAKSVVRRRPQIAIAQMDDETVQQEFKWAMKSEARQRLEAMLALARADKLIADTGQNWDSDPWLLGVANGVVDLRTGKLRPGRQSDFITMHAEVPFDPNAQAARWLRFLEETFDANRELIDFVHRAVGYSLTGLTMEQCFFCCFGSGSNGKSTFLEVLRYVLGGYAHNMPFSTLELTARTAIPNDVASLAGRRMITGSETNEAAQWNEQRVKALTGSDSITARFLYKEHFTFSAVAKFWLAFNHKPRVSDDSHGFWRRVRLVPFQHKFEGDAQDKQLLTKLQAEAVGILAWAIQGCLEWQQQGLAVPEVVRAETQSYREEMDVIGQFLMERCVVDSNVSVTAKALWDEYYFWAADNGEKADRKLFAARLAARGFTKSRVGHERNRVLDAAGRSRIDA